MGRIRAGASLLVVACVLAVAAAGPLAADEIIGAKKSKVYHTHDCSSARKIIEENRIQFASAREAQLAGRRLCKLCARLDAERKTESSATLATKPRRHGAVRPTPGPDDQPAKAVAATQLPEFVRVRRVISGGTFVLDNGEKARLLGVACPGKGQPRESDAVRFLHEQTRGRLVRLSYDPDPGAAGRRDALGRLQVYMSCEPDGRDLGSELIFQGYAWLDRAARFERRGEYARREEEAWRAGRGIWKQLEGEAGQREVVTGRHALHYHPPKCPHEAHLTDKSTMTLNEARSRRLTPCSAFRVRRKGK